MYVCKMPRYTTAALLAMLPLLAAEQRGVVKFGGLPLPGATVTATQADKKFVAASDIQGVYSFPDLVDGVWTIQVEMLCFETLKRDVTVVSGTPALEWELKLLPREQVNAVAMSAGPAPATVAQSIESSGAKSEKQPDGGSRAGDATTAPNDANNFGADGSGDLSQRATDGFLINGSTNNSASSPFGLGPAFGNNRRNLRSLYNGNIGITLDNAALDARPFSLTGQDTPKLAYNRMTGLFSFGGPMRIPRLFRNGPNFTVNYQWTRNRNSTAQSTLMPTALERNGDFSQTLNSLGQPIQFVDPKTGAPFQNNRIPQSQLSPQAQALLNFYPLPNFTGSARYNYQIPINTNTHQDNLQTRVNRALGRQNQVSGNFAYQSIRTDSPNAFGFLDATNTLGINSAANWRHTFSPRLFQTLGYQFSRYDVRTTAYFENRQNVSADAGITGNNQEPINWGPPNLDFASGIGSLSDATPSFVRNQTSGASYSMLWSRSGHNITFGGDLRRQQFNLLSQQNPRGTFTFTGAATQAIVNGKPSAGTGSDLAGFLIGIPDTSAIAYGNADKYFRSWFDDAYITDDWRLSPGFTLNAGVRWEYGSPITELYGRLVNLDVASGFSAVAPVVANHPVGSLTGAAYPSSLIQPNRHGFQPRVAFSWRPFAASSTVVRGGYGVYYNTSVYLPIATQMAQQSPLSKSLSVPNNRSNPFTLADGFNVLSSVTPNTFAVDPNFRPGYSQNWQLSVQRDLPGALVMTATYQGVKGTRGAQLFLPNTYPAGAPNPCLTCPAGFTYLTSNGNSTREAGQLQLRRRLHSGFTASVDYTFSKSIDDAAFGGRNQPPVIAQDWLNLSGERALSSFDQRHLLKVLGQYTTGMGLKGGTLLGGWKGALLKEWTFVTQINAGSGLPLSPVYLAAVNGTGVTGPLRPDYTGANLYAAPPGFFLNPAAYAAPASGRWGNAGRNSITGPSQFSLNASVGRTFRASDRVDLDVRLDAANALNHVTFPSWDTTFMGRQFGLPNATNPMRSIQLTMRARF